MAALYGFGAAGAQTIEDVLARRLAWEKFRAAQDAENRRLAMAEETAGQNRELHPLKLREATADVTQREAVAREAPAQAPLVTRGMEADVEGKEFKLGRDVLGAQREDEGRATFGQTPVGQRILPALDAGAPLERFNLFDPEGLTAFERQKELERQRAQTQRSVANIYASAKGSENLTSPQQLAAINTLNRQYIANPSVKAALEMRRQLSLMRGAIQRMTTGQSRDFNADSQAVLVTFQKILDPTSVVRESEYARSAEGQAVMDRLRGAVTKLARGGQGVPPESLKNFLAAAEKMYENVDSYRSREAERIGKIADRYQLPRELVLSDEPLDAAATESPRGYANPQNVVPER